MVHAADLSSRTLAITALTSLNTMNNDLTYNTIAFKLGFSDKDGSRRQSTVARGVGLPDTLTIRSQRYVDSSTKTPGTRFVVRLDQVSYNETAGKQSVSSAYVVLQIADDSAVSNGDIATLLQTFKAAVADATLLGAVLNGEQ